MIKHPHFEECIASIDVREFNWLNFNLEDEEKLKIFKKGAEAAAEFLKNLIARLQERGYYRKNL